MKLLFIIITLLFLLGSSQGQSFDIDSLKESLSRASSGEDKVDLLNQLSDTFRKISDIDTGLKYGNQALELSRKINYTHGEVMALNYLGLNLRDRSEYFESKQYFNKALLMLKNSSDSIQLAYTYNNIGTIDRMIGNYGAALEHMMVSKSIFQKCNHLEGLAHVIINIGLLSNDQKQYEKAIDNFELAKSLLEELEDNNGFLYSLYQLGRANFKLGKYKKALSYYKIGMDFLDTCDDCLKRHLGDMLTGLGEVYDVLGNYNLSLNSFQLAIQINEQAGERNNLAILYNSIGNVYLKTKEYLKAKHYFDKAYSLAELIELDSRILDVLLSYSKLYKQQGNYKQAVQYFEAYNDLRDTLFSSQKMREIANIETKHAVLEQEKQNEILQERLDYQKIVENYLIVIVVLSIMIIFFIYSFLRNIISANKELKKLNRTKDLFFSIIAHDIKNPFGAVLNFSEMLKEDLNNMSLEEIHQFADSIYSSSREVYQLLENLLYWARSQKGDIKLEKKNIVLNDALQDVYRVLKNHAEGKKIIFTNEVPRDVKVHADENILKTVLRNLINNAVKFTGHGGEIKVSTSQNNGIVEMSIADNGVGMDEDELKKLFDIGTSSNKSGTDGEKGSGLGLILCKEFVEINGGQISVKSKEGIGSTFTLTVPTAIEL
ncbi:MAG: tetratricopeptide repeat protein [Bacteroidetes bacterium]|nr:tetratricopeptide repeat protein [Bacteroidota bacterium]